MVVDVEALAKSPSPESWRLLCQALADMPEPSAMRLIQEITRDLDSWPDELRATMCGMDWDDRFFAGNPDPRSVIVRFLRHDRIFSGRYGGMMIRTPTLDAEAIRGLCASDGARHLTKIDLSYHRLGAEGARMLASATRFDALRSLQLVGCDLDRQALEALAHAPFYGSLQNLSLMNNNLAGEAIAPLFERGVRVPQELALSSNPLGEEGAAVIAVGLGPMAGTLGLADCALQAQGVARLATCKTELESLGVSNNELGDEGLVALVSGALRARKLWARGDSIGSKGVRALVEAGWPLTQLDLADNALDDEAARLLADLGPDTLEALNLSDNDVTADGLSALVASEHLRALRKLELSTNRIGFVRELAPTMQDLEELDIADNRLGDDGARALLHVQANGLRSLGLARNDISAPALEALSGAPWFGGLTSLDVSGNPLGNAAGVLLGARPLEHLRMARTSLDDDGLEALSKADFRPKTLVLSHCDLTDRALEMLAASPILERVESLSLDGNAITNKGATALVRSQHARALKVLSLENNRVGDEGVVALAQWERLLHVDLDGNPYGSQGEKALSALPRRCCP